MIDRTISHHPALRKLTEGGGGGHQAHCAHADRSLGVPVPPPEESFGLSGSAVFVQEAKALDRWNHPNVVTIRDFDRSADVDSEVVFGPGAA